MFIDHFDQFEYVYLKIIDFYLSFILLPTFILNFQLIVQNSERPIE